MKKKMQLQNMTSARGNTSRYIIELLKFDRIVHWNLYTGVVMGLGDYLVPIFLFAVELLY